MRRPATAVATVILAAFALESAAEEIRLGPDPMAAVVEHLREGRPAARLDLAWIAMAELLGAYETALEQAGHPGGGAGRAKLHRWQSGTAAYVADLRRRLSELDRGAEVELKTGPRGRLLVLVGRRPTLITGPDIARAEELERRILDRFCRIHDCPAPERPSPRPTEPPSPGDGAWSFADHRAVRYETPDGLAFELPGLQDRSRRRAVCEALARELRLLARGLRSAARSGHPVDWAALRIIEPPQGEEPRVVLGSGGDHLRLPVPLLAAHPRILEQALPWVRARAAGHRHSVVIQGVQRLVDSAPGG